MTSMIQFCEHQKCEPCKPPVCTAYIFNHEHPICAYTNDDFAFHNCRSFKKVEQLKTIEQAINDLTERLDKLEYNMDKTLLRMKFLLGDDKK